MEEFKGNSNRSKEEAEERREVNPVVKGSVKVKKESVGKKFSNVFLSDTFDNVKNYLVFDVIVPAVKDLVVDMISNGTNMLVYGNSSSGRSRNKRSGEKTSYTSYYRGGSNKDKDERKTVSRDRHGLSEIIFESRTDAKEVTDMMLELLDKFKVVSVADYYELSNAADLESYTDRKYGWYELDEMTITRDREGYKIRLPRPEPLD